MSLLLIVVVVYDIKQANENPRQMRAECATNLQKISLALLEYQRDNNGHYPESLESLPLTEGISPAVLVCPFSKDTPATGATPAELKANLQKPGHCSYIYLGNGLTDTTTPKDAVIAYEPLSDNAGNGEEGIYVLYGDGHDDWADKSVARKILAKVASTTRPVTFP
jgi:hypothetical protein